MCNSNHFFIIVVAQAILDGQRPLTHCWQCDGGKGVACKLFERVCVMAWGKQVDQDGSGHHDCH